MSIYRLIQKKQKINERLSRSISSKPRISLNKELHLVSEIIENVICTSKNASKIEVQFTLEALSRTVLLNGLSGLNEPRHQ